MSRVYFHIDLNAFFASCEELLDPSLKGKPLVVGGKSRRSVISTANYEARKYGIHSAMPMQQAEKLCKDLVVVNGHYAFYSDMSHQFMQIIHSYTDLVEKASIDECYADMTDVICRYPKPLDVAFEIQRRVLEETGLRCSIGIGPNMFLAKMASDMKKPMGITVLRIRDVPEKMWPLPIKEMQGIGKRTVPLMEDLNIHTIKDLATYQDLNALKPVLGKNIESMIKRANGYDDRTLMTDYDSKSMGISETLLEDVTDYDELRGLIRTLCRRLSKRLKEAHKAGYHVSMRICYYDFRNANKSKKLSAPIWTSDDLFVQAMILFDSSYEEEEAVRLIGVSVSDFASEEFLAKQVSLFDAPEEESTSEILHDLNHQLGTQAFVRASSLLENDK
ncbi:MAG: DNA polymerase IV [Erysipelotrichaceae bacterium]|nr:DNA polymerase IV [Erysipelotrichaceae bacterium]MDD7058844.1 DNA polymerase IV [Erysipelotrichaceae bacterium]MDY3659545.1 DNA polymerase IV [Bulleidia sp.]